MSGITIPCVSPTQILHDLTDCVTTCDMKVAKRLNRLKVVCHAMGIDYDQYISRHILVEERNMTIGDDEVLAYLQRPPAANQEFEIELKMEGYDDTIKKVIEAELTSRLNSDLTLYCITAGIASRIFKRVARHSIFAPLVRDRSIIFVHKGGIAQRLVLLESYPKHRQEIETYFGYGGDNDCNILVDPELEDYHPIRSLLVQYVYQQMMALVGAFSCGTTDVRAKHIESIQIGNLEIPVTPTMRQHFKINPVSESCPLLNLSVMKCGVYTSYNDSLEFRDEISRLCHFTLLRYKKAFQVGNRVLGAELLDISIPHRDEDKAVEHFNHYRDGSWISNIHLE